MKKRYVTHRSRDRTSISRARPYGSTYWIQIRRICESRRTPHREYQGTLRKKYRTQKYEYQTNIRHR